MSYEDKYLLVFMTFQELHLYSHLMMKKKKIILKDRLHIIRTNGFTTHDKKNIVKNYLLDDNLKESCFPQENIIMTDDVIKYIIDKYTSGEAGVRELKRNIDQIITKLNLIYTLYSDENIKTRLNGFLKLKNEYKCPCHLSNTMVDELLTPKNNSISKLMMYV